MTDIQARRIVSHLPFGPVSVPATADHNITNMTIVETETRNRVLAAFARGVEIVGNSESGIAFGIVP